MELSSTAGIEAAASPSQSLGICNLANILMVRMPQGDEKETCIQHANNDRVSIYSWLFLGSIDWHALLGLCKMVSF